MLPSITPQQSLVTLDSDRNGEPGWALVWSHENVGPKISLLSQSWLRVSSFLREATGNEQWICPLCQDVTSLVDGGHWGGRKHAKAVCYELGKMNASHGPPGSTYTNVVYTSQSLWMFKAGQPTARGSFTAAVSLLGGACYLLAGKVLVPGRASTSSLPLAIEFDPRVAG